MKKLVFLDIETTPNISYTWGKYDQNVLAFKKEWELLSLAWKVKGDKEVRSAHGSDWFLTTELHRLLDKADIIVAHNGDQFDIKKAKAKFLEHGLRPPSPFKTVDTCKIAKEQFNLNSNKLDDLGKLLKVGRKIKNNGIDLWLDCMAGNKKALSQMIRYNKQDVVLLEKVYNKLLAWMPNHPPIGGDHACPNCGGENLQRRGFTFTAASKFQRYQCNDCGRWSKARKREKDYSGRQIV